MDSMVKAAQYLLAVACSVPVQVVIISIILAIFLPFAYHYRFGRLSSFKGPWYMKASDTVYAFLQLQGTSQYTLRKAHDKYGDVVRIGPRTLSFIDPKAWDDIYGLRKGGVAALPKDPLFYNEMLLGKETITLATDKDAIPIRRAMNTAFSPKTLAEQAGMMQEHMTRLMEQLNKESLAAASDGVDLHRWYTMSMFDINSEFGFGEDMGCVKRGEYHSWVQFVLDFFFAATLIHQCNKFWPLARILMLLTPPWIRKNQRLHNEASLRRVRRRMDLDLDKSDFMYHFSRSARKEGLSIKTIEEQASVVILAGSETSASGLTSATYHILSHPEVHRKVRDEVESVFASVSEITLKKALNELPFLGAVIWEALRLHTPLANGFTRVVPKWQTDFTICGRAVPPSTVVTINHYCANTSARNFHRPLDFVPDRWLGHEEFKSDHLEVVQPFSVGPRNCPGRNFALQNIRLALVYMIMTFDMELSAGMQKWADRQRLYNGWMQPPLLVSLKARQGALN